MFVDRQKLLIALSLLTPARHSRIPKGPKARHPKVYNFNFISASYIVIAIISCFTLHIRVFCISKCDNVFIAMIYRASVQAHVVRPHFGGGG